MLLPGPEVLADKDGDVQGNIFGRHVDWLCLPTNQSISSYERKKPQAQKKEIRLHQ
jgi:hypothetical protein